MVIPFSVSGVDDASHPTIPAHISRGLSPKKSHEVSRFAAFLHSFVRSRFSIDDDARRKEVVFVDVGSGLGYLG